MKLSSILKMEGSNDGTCNYIEGFGDDYIMTDIYPVTGMRVEFKLSIYEENDTKGYFGGRSSQQEGKGIALWQVSGKFRKDYGNPGSDNNGVAEETIVLGKTYEDSISGTASFTSNSPLVIFSVNTDNIVDRRIGKARIYYIKIYDKGNNIIHDLEPHIENNRGYIKDLITGKEYKSKNDLIIGG